MRLLAAFRMRRQTRLSPHVPLFYGDGGGDLARDAVHQNFDRDVISALGRRRYQNIDLPDAEFGGRDPRVQDVRVRDVNGTQENLWIQGSWEQPLAGLSLGWSVWNKSLPRTE